MGQSVKLSAADGEMGLYVERPQGTPKGALIVIQEAFGVNSHMQNVCKKFAADGYVAVSPHIFYRTGDAIIPYEKMQEVIPHIAALKAGGLLGDVDAVLTYLKGEGFDAKRVGIVGYCLGGSIAALVAGNREIGAAVSYYGGGITAGRFGGPAIIEMAPNFKTPWLGQYGDLDLSIPFTEVEMLRKAAKAAPVPTDMFRYEADHGFNCDERPAVYNEAAAKEAWGRTLQWFDANLAKS
jgi:carboxymethylenebutenolidase